MAKVHLDTQTIRYMEKTFNSIISFLDFSIKLLVLHFNADLVLGFEILTFDSTNADRSLLGVMFDPYYAKWHISVFFFNFIF